MLVAKIHTSSVSISSTAMLIQKHKTAEAIKPAKNKFMNEKNKQTIKVFQE